MLAESTAINSTGILPWTYEVRIGDTAYSGGLARQLFDLNSITVGYEINDNRAYFGTWDAFSVKGQFGNIPSTVLPEPKNGDDVVITAVSDGFEQIVFAGKMDSVATHITSDGAKRYGCSASSNIVRLNEYRITAHFNPLNDPNMPQPKFDPVSGAMVDTRPKTVAQIVEQIMLFPNAWGTTEHFEFADIDWGDLFDSPECGAFVPSSIPFSDTPKGDAIRDVLSRAGSYELMYDPQTDKLYVVQLNLACNRCGDQWPITFALADTGSGESSVYSGDLQVIADSTAWESRGSANVCRATSAPIRFYSGDYIIPEITETATQYDAASKTFKAVPEGQRLRDVGADTVAKQKLRAKNQEGVPYRWDAPKGSAFLDQRKYRQYPVGLPLFPDWPVHLDYLPDMVSIYGVNAPKNAAGAEQWVNGLKAEDYIGKSEYAPLTRGQQLLIGASRTTDFDHMKVYQAWYIDKVCPCCKGSGNVAAIYSGGENRPNIVFSKIGSTPYEQYKITNYIFEPNDFGKPSAYDSPGLTPWVATQSQPYPMPWLNLCPGCRGVGYKPEYRIRSVQPDLVRSRAINKADKADGNQSISLDPQFTQAAPESWQESQNRVLFSSGPVVAVEMGVETTHRLPKSILDASLSWQQLLQKKPTEVTMTHPLKGYVKRLTQLVGVNPAAANAQLTSPLRSTEVRPIYTTIMYGNDDYELDPQMGQVIFKRPQAITCSMSFGKLRGNETNGQSKFELAPSGFVDDRPKVGGEPEQSKGGKPFGFFRPARAWLQCFYKKDGLYSFSDETAEVNYTNADGETNKYLARAMVLDGRWSVEVVKKDPSSWGGDDAEFGNDDRVVQTAITDTESVIEVMDGDLRAMLVPAFTGTDLAAYEQYRVDQGMQFVRAHLFRWDKPTAGETAAEIEGVPAEQFAQGMYRPRFYDWRLRDDRPKLLGLAIRKLETENDLKVSGSLTLRGMTHKIKGGLGYINYPGRAKAAVVKITHQFSRGYNTLLEVSRREARAGQLPPDDEMAIADFKKQFRQFTADTEKRRLMGTGESQKSQVVKPNAGGTNTSYS